MLSDFKISILVFSNRNKLLADHSILLISFSVPSQNISYVSFQHRSKIKGVKINLKWSFFTNN